MKLRSLVAAVVFLGLALPGLTGCDKHAEDKAAVRLVWEQMENAYQMRDGVAAVSLMTARSFPYYERLMRIAVGGTRDEIRALTAIERMGVLMMRHRAGAVDMANLGGDGRGYVRMSTQNGWWESEDRDWIRLGEVVIDSDYARARVIEDGVKTGYWYQFVREDDSGQPSPNGIWKLDDPESDVFLNAMIARQAQAEGMSEDDFLIAWEEEDTGSVVRRDIWDKPPGKVGGTAGKQ